MEKYENIHKAFMNFFDHHDLLLQIKDKVDSKSFKKFSDEKASRKEMSQHKEAIDKLHQKLTQLSILQSELAH